MTLWLIYLAGFFLITGVLHAANRHGDRADAVLLGLIWPFAVFVGLVIFFVSLPTLIVDVFVWLKDLLKDLWKRRRYES